MNPQESENTGPSYELLKETPGLAEAKDHGHDRHDVNANTESQSLHVANIHELEVSIDDAAEKCSDTARPFLEAVISEWFVWEALAVGVSGGILIAIIVVLASYDGKPQPTWKYMSLNSLISWLSTVSKGSILYSVNESLGQSKWTWFAQKSRPISDLQTFDFASRGFLGALTMIWKLRARHFTVLGCLIVLLALGFDPFAQNLIHYQQRMTPDTSQKAVVGNVSTYNSAGFYFGPGTSGVDAILKSNVYNSLFNSDRGKPWSIPQYLCSSANCTWDPIVSLEAHALCANITDRLSKSCKSTDYPDTGSTNCTLRLPRSGTTASFVKEYVPMVRGFTVSAVGPTEAYVYTNASMHAIQFITPRVANISTLSTIHINHSTWDVVNDMDKWDATECSIEPIVRRSKPLVRNNIFTDETLAIWNARSPSAAGSNASYVDYDPAWRMDPPWGTDMGMQPNRSFVLGGEARLAISMFLRIIFSGHFRRDPLHQAFSPADDQGTMYAAVDVLQALGQGDIVGCGVESVDRLRCSVRNVAAAISKTFRDSNYLTAGSDPDRADMARGRGMVSVMYVSVHWQWIVLPLLVWVLGAAVLAGTIWMTRLTSAPRWRNDPLPLLFLYRDDGADDELGGVPTPGVRCETSRLRARLLETDGRMTLV